MPGELYEGDGHLWAVSYADLLMVLMCFFVVYFSFTDAPPESGDTRDLQQIALGIEGGQSVKPGPAGDKDSGTTAAGAASGAAAGVAVAASTAEKIPIDGKALRDLGARTHIEDKYLYIDLPDNIFPTKKFSLDQQTKESLNKIYKTLGSIQNKIEVIVIGHSDSSAIREPINPYLSNNFDLSSLRALRGLQHLLTLGFPAANASAQGSADGTRNSRSLSLRIQMKELRI